MILERDILNKVSSNQLINSPAMCKLNKWKGKNTIELRSYSKYMYSVWIYVVCATILLHFHNSFPCSPFPSPISNPWQQKCYFKSRLPLLPSRPNLQIISLPETELTLTWLRYKSFLQDLKIRILMYISKVFTQHVFETSNSEWPPIQSEKT